LDNGYFSINQRVEEIREIYEKASNKFKKFADECLEEVEDGYIVRRHSWWVFQEWCSEENVPSESFSNFVRKLNRNIKSITKCEKRIGEVKQSGSEKGNRKKVRCWRGLHIKKEWADKVDGVVAGNPTPEDLGYD